jgi:uncharacterized oligopeptide transporter (OPT) family protein
MPEQPAPTPTSVRVMRNIDVPVLALALVVFLAASLPILGWVTGTVAWAVQRGVSELATRKANASTDPRTKVGVLAGSMIARGWIVAGIIIAVGLKHNDDGLSAAILFLAVFTVQFTMTLATRPFEIADRSAKKP